LNHLVAPDLVELVKGAGKLADAGQVEVVDCGFGHFTLSPGGWGILSDSLPNVHEMFTTVTTGFFLGRDGRRSRARIFDQLACEAIPFSVCSFAWLGQTDSSRRAIMADQIVITGKSSQANDVRAAVGSRYLAILSAEGHLFDLLEPEDAVPAFGERGWL
jgi:hypothetical protein